MLTIQELATLKAASEDPDRARLLDTLRRRAAPVIATMPPIPRVKALLSRDGGVCPDDGAPLEFNPWSPDRHTCTRCGRAFEGERHHRHWARAQHLWLAERMAELALLDGLTDDPAAAARAAELIAVYDELYFELPNRDNVLGPSHLFFSTYVESLWITSYLAAAFMLRESGRLTEARIERVNRVADEAARIIAEFNEGFSNRQTWYATALTAIAAWFGDDELAKSTVESPTGLIGHLTDGFGSDGLWWEGENYHLFALRGLMLGIHWARAVGFELLDDEALRSQFRNALLAPSRSALPDFTYPARRDARYGVSLAQPASLELWEIGRGWLPDDPELDSWLGALYRAAVPAGPALLYDAWLHNAGQPALAQPGRSDLSWWALTALTPLGAPESLPPWNPGSVLLTDQGLAVLRLGDTYASVECGREIGGHGHPDRLHLTVHAGGIHWLPDPGTGSYVEPQLAWYRSALAHNAPLLDGANAGGQDAWCEVFEASGEWGWCRARAGEARRTVLLGRSHLVDILEVEAAEQREVILPWHFQGALTLETPGTWEPIDFPHPSPFVAEAERFVVSTRGQRVVEARDGAAVLRSRFLSPTADLVKAVAPGLPNTSSTQPFVLLRERTNRLRWVTVLDLSRQESAPFVLGARETGEDIDIDTPAGVVRHRLTETGVSIEHSGTRITLAGARQAPPRRKPFFSPPQIPGVEAFAPMIATAPALDGSLDGFDTSAPLILDGEHQYRRSEEPFDPESFSAEAWVNWDGNSLFLAVAVAKPEVVLRSPTAAPLQLDNEAEDINSDGLQIYVHPEGPVAAALIVPVEGGGLHSRAIGESEAPDLGVEGSWSRTETGYLVTLRLDDPRAAGLPRGESIGFDLLINEMQPDRQRRAGQLVWSGGGGWVYLRGDRHDPGHLGILVLG